MEPTDDIVSVLVNEALSVQKFGAKFIIYLDFFWDQLEAS